MRHLSQRHLSQRHLSQRHLSDEDLVLLYYNEPGAPGDARTHLVECSECRAAAESLAQTLDACNEWSIPEPGAGFGRTVWARLAPRLELRRRPLFEMRVWLVGAAAAAMLIAAFLAGRVTSHPAPTFTAALSPQARDRIIAISLADHFERAQLLLTEVANMNDADSAELAADRARSRDLANEGRLMRQVLLTDPENAGMLPLLEEVGRFVVEVANAPDRMNPADIGDLKRRIDAESLLFKVRIIEANLRSSNTQGKLS